MKEFNQVEDSYISAEKRVILIFIGGYLPGKNYGGPVTSLENFASHLGDLYDIRIISNDHDFKETERYKNIHDGWNIVGKARVYYINEKDYSYECFKEIISPFKDNIAMFYLSSIFYVSMNIPAMKLGYKYNIPVILAPRGDLMRNAISMNGWLKKSKKLLYLFSCKFLGIYKNIYFQSTSSEETSGLKHYLGIDERRIFEIPNLPMSFQEHAIRNKEKGELRILSLSRIMVKKNILDTIKAVDLVSEDYSIVLDIYGPLEDQEYWAECLSEIEHVSTEKKIIRYRGALSPEEAKAVYKNYECFAFPTLSENYGHTIIEAMLSDCPVLLTRGTTPWDEYEGNGVYLSELHDIEALALNIEKFAKMDDAEYENELLKNRNFIHETLKIENQVNAYVSMIEKVSKK